MLEGNYRNDDLDDATQLWISHFKHHLFENDVPMQPYVTGAQFIGKMKIWKESTSTSPSGYHLGHWKSLCARHSLSGQDTTESEALDAK